ncbi:MAG: preprotein translocase subunit YajC [Actinobacteria bacterium]|jgi:preprotein translocase subunit YajC|nr:preprotein translocase subunit YajC [Actinomycetota bacterium]NBT27160.1 preprotein translocase subunit YajC [Actinomycetota bacterium]NBT37703.1 preprotein translocase subunit YajC [Actinomycetota bacterium]NBY11623.1 preprotein translocase subunit YajC [Actinomycetota bacterium]NCZ92984.1 preprotein translocase subunit YajC [Actinomycetota bacterium]
MFAILFLAQSTSTSSGGGILGLLPLVAIFGAMYFLLLRPQRKRTKQAQELQKSISEGDEVILNSGIYGFVSEVNDTFVWLDVADEVEIRVARSAIASKVSAPSADGQTDSKK